jgi:hypothetical protein
MRDSRALTEARYNQIEDCDPLAEEVKIKVQRVIASKAENVADAVELMMMLGVHPCQADATVYHTEATQHSPVASL